MAAAIPAIVAIAGIASAGASVYGAMESSKNAKKQANAQRDLLNARKQEEADAAEENRKRIAALSVLNPAPEGNFGQATTGRGKILGN